MGFDRLKYTKVWTNAVDFPTVETDEAQVRADIQLLHDESKDALNKLMDSLEDSGAAVKMGAVGPQGEKSTIQDELDGLHKGMIEAGALPVGGSTDQMLVKSSEENYQTRWASIAEIIAAIQAQANGVASLNGEGEIPLGQIPKELRDLIAAGLPWKLIDTIDNTRGYSGQWEAPDVFGDGSAFDLGVYMIGGGGSAGAACASKKSETYKYSAYADGGASGYGKNHVFNSVVPGATYDWVIGAGGEEVSASVSAGSNASTEGNAGGTTSFGGVVANGGDGGEACVSNDGNLNYPVRGGQPNVASYSGSVELYYGGINIQGRAYAVTEAQSAREGQNQFDPTMVTLAGGFSASAYTNHNGSSYVQSSSKSSPAEGWAPTHGVVGTAVNSASASVTNAVTPTYGNGGGAAACAKCDAALTATGGKGGDGIILLYARKAVAE